MSPLKSAELGYTLSSDSLKGGLSVWQLIIIPAAWTVCCGRYGHPYGYALLLRGPHVASGPALSSLCVLVRWREPYLHTSCCSALSFRRGILSLGLLELVN